MMVTPVVSSPPVYRGYRSAPVHIGIFHVINKIVGIDDIAGTPLHMDTAPAASPHIIPLHDIPVPHQFYTACGATPDIVAYNPIFFGHHPDTNMTVIYGVSINGSIFGTVHIYSSYCFPYCIVVQFTIFGKAQGNSLCQPVIHFMFYGVVVEICIV